MSKKETVDETRGRDYQDALLIEENIKKETLYVAKLMANISFPTVPVTKGEREVVSLYLEGKYDAIASDDKRFLKKLEAANIPFLTPAACVVYIFKKGRIKMLNALEMLEKLKPFIAIEEYMIAKFYLEGKSCGQRH